MQIPSIIQKELLELTAEDIRLHCGEMDGHQLAAVRAFIGWLAPDGPTVYDPGARIPTRLECRDRAQAIADECMADVRYYNGQIREQQGRIRAERQHIDDEERDAERFRRETLYQRAARAIAADKPLRDIASEVGYSQSWVRDHLGHLLSARKAVKKEGGLAFATWARNVRRDNDPTTVEEPR